MNKNRKLLWRHLKGLNELYETGHTKVTILGNHFIKYLFETEKIIGFKMGNHNILQARNGFKPFYKEQLLIDFKHYESFFINEGIEPDARNRFDEEDICTLILISKFKQEFKSKLTSIRVFSNNLFKGSKYLETHPGLKKIVCKILDIDDFPDKDPKNHQWRLIIDCVNPIAVVLCENMAHLKRDWKSVENNIELWYVGGNNIHIIENISQDKLAKPLYYSCDWDYHGLSIYGRIKKKFKDKGKEIKLLYPSNPQQRLDVNCPNHKSQWKGTFNFSGLNETDFNDKEKNLIAILIKTNQWIEEEGSDLFLSLNGMH